MPAVALITGAAHGIGRTLALLLARDGYAIAALDLDADALAKLSADLGNAPHATAVGDVTRGEELAAHVRALEEKLGPTDLLIANAGVGREPSALDFRA